MNQIDVACEIEEILEKSGLEWSMAFDPETTTYYFKLTNIDNNTGKEKQDEI